MTNMERERKRRQWTQTELAFRAGLHQSQVSAIERGKLEPSDEVRAALAAQLRIELETLLDEVDRDGDAVEAKQ